MGMRAANALSREGAARSVPRKAASATAAGRPGRGHGEVHRAFRAGLLNLSAVVVIWDRKVLCGTCGSVLGLCTGGQCYPLVVTAQNVSRRCHMYLRCRDHRFRAMSPPGGRRTPRRICWNVRRQRRRASCWFVARVSWLGRYPDRYLVEHHPRCFREGVFGIQFTFKSVDLE